MAGADDISDTSSVSSTAEGEIDAMYHAFFSYKSKAALLACDSLGIIPSDLLFHPKSLFIEDCSRRVGAPSRRQFGVRSNVVELMAALAYNQHECGRFSRFLALFREREALVLSGKLNEMWSQRQKLAGLPVDAEPEGVPTDPPLPPSPTTPPLAQNDPLRRASTGSFVNRSPERSIASTKYPKLPHPDSILAPRELNMATLQKQEVALTEFLHKLHAYALLHIKAEIKILKEQQEAATKAELERKEAYDPAKLPLVLVPQPPKLRDETRLKEFQQKSADREMAALVRSTMGTISKSAIADQKARAYETPWDPNSSLPCNCDALERQKDAALLRRKAASPSTYSIPTAPSVARRPPTAGVDSSSVAAIRLSQIEELRRSREENYERKTTAATARVQSISEQKLVGRATLGEAADIRLHLYLSNRERHLRAVELKKESDFQKREDRRRCAASKLAERKAMASYHRERHEQMRRVRGGLANSIWNMSVESKWNVPEQIRGVLPALQVVATTTTSDESC